MGFLFVYKRNCLWGTTTHSTVQHSIVSGHRRTLFFSTVQQPQGVEEVLKPPAGKPCLAHNCWHTDDAPTTAEFAVLTKRSKSTDTI